MAAPLVELRPRNAPAPGVKRAGLGQLTRGTGEVPYLSGLIGAAITAVASAAATDISQATRRLNSQSQPA